jgi:hypothetical protein
MATTAIRTQTQTSELHKVWLTLKLTFAIVPIVAGLDKFTNILVDWSKYLSTEMVSILPVTASTFMLVVGVIEIAAGLIVFFKTELGAYIVAGWLVCIALSLLISWSYPDVAVRDLVMAVGAFSLARLSRVNHEG